MMVSPERDAACDELRHVQGRIAEAVRVAVRVAVEALSASRSRRISRAISRTNMLLSLALVAGVPSVPVISIGDDLLGLLGPSWSHLAVRGSFCVSIMVKD